MLISLIVTTREDRIDKFNRFLASLSEGDYKLIEVVVVSQDCSNLVIALLPEYQERFCIKHIPSARCGISTARNVGLKHAAGLILGFPDDDCWYAADTLSRISQRFASHSREAFVCAAVVDPVRNLPFGHKRTSENDVGISVANAFTFPISVGIFINRSLIESPTAFDERLGAGTKWGSGEETDLILSLILLGHQGTFLPSITVYHEINYDRSDLFPISKVFSYSSGFGAVIAKSIVERKQYAAMWVYADLLARASVKLIWAIVTFQKSSYRLHLSRTKGMLFGLIEGARYFAH